MSKMINTQTQNVFVSIAKRISEKTLFSNLISSAASTDRSLQFRPGVEAGKPLHTSNTCRDTSGAAANPSQIERSQGFLGVPSSSWS